MRTFLLILFSAACTSCCLINGGRQMPPNGVWTYSEASFVHSLGIEIDLFSDGTFHIREAARDRKMLTRSYVVLGAGTYIADEQAIELTFSEPVKHTHTFRFHHLNEEPPRVIRGTFSESGKKMTLDYFTETLVFKWRSPS